MRLLYTNILPLRTPADKLNFTDYFEESFSKSDTVLIASGYVSKGSLDKLRQMVANAPISHITLIVGMYYQEGMPEGIYHTLCSLNAEWKSRGVGCIRIVRPFSYHGKVYSFYKNDTPVAAIVGSNNLGSIKLEAGNLRQYEVSLATEDASEINEINQHIMDLSQQRCSVDLDDIHDMPLIHQRNMALIEQEFVDKVTPEDVSAYKEHTTALSFDIPLKVPQNNQDDHMRGSNINVCYAEGRKRVWWECEIVVSKEIRGLPGYPEFQHPFMAVTDDGYKFLVWTCGATNKNLYSKDDLKIMGRWIKGRLVAAGLVEPANDVKNDPDCHGLITEDTLRQYGRNYITITKTDLTTTGDDGNTYDVWYMSFLPNGITLAGGDN